MTRQHGATSPRLAWLWALTLLSAGCARDQVALQRAPHAGDESHWLTHRLPVVDRGHVAPDLSLVTKFTPPAYPPEPTPPYHALTEAEAQCLAASNSTLGNLLATERRTAGATSGCACRGSERAETLRLHLLSFAEIEARNDSAFAALELYYRLALAENQIDTLGKSRHELAETKNDVAELVRRGVSPPADVGGLDRQELKLADKNVDAEIARGQLNENLRSLIGVTSREPTWRVWPTSPLTIDPTPLDVEMAVVTALNERPELGMLRLLEAELDQETLPVARAALSRADALLGFTAPPGCFAAINTLRCVIERCKNDPCEVENRRYQINQYRARREGEVAAEVRAAAATVQQRLDQVLFARGRLASFDENVEQLTSQQATGGATFIQVSTARLERAEAEAELMSRVIDWHLAVVRFHHTQGVLAAQCGYHATYRCWLVPKE